MSWTASLLLRAVQNGSTLEKWQRGRLQKRLCNPCWSGYSKRRRHDVLPLPSNIVDMARGWLDEKKAGEALWPGSWAKNRYAGRMLKADLEAAGIPYQNNDGEFADFHALRHTFISNLARGGVPLATAQKLARHSTPVLTAARYTHIDLADQSKEVEKLPQLGRNLGRAWGTNGQNVASDGTGPTAENFRRKVRAF